LTPKGASSVNWPQQFSNHPTSTKQLNSYRSKPFTKAIIEEVTKEHFFTKDAANETLQKSETISMTSRHTKNSVRVGLEAGMGDMKTGAHGMLSKRHFSKRSLS